MGPCLVDVAARNSTWKPQFTRRDLLVKLGANERDSVEESGFGTCERTRRPEVGLNTLKLIVVFLGSLTARR